MNRESRQRVASPRVKPTVTSVKRYQRLISQPKAYKKLVSLVNPPHERQLDVKSVSICTGTTHQRLVNAYDLQ